MSVYAYILELVYHIMIVAEVLFLGKDVQKICSRFTSFANLYALQLY